MSTDSGNAGGAGLCALAVDDEAPALEDLAYLLRADARLSKVLLASGAAEALRLLEAETIDVVFLDIHMPGLDGLDVARVLARFAHPPAVVFVTAYDDHAVDAFELRAVDYLMKPVRQERLAEAIRRIADSRAAAEPDPATVTTEVPDENIPVELAGVTRFIARKDVLYVEAHGDYARLFTKDGSHLLRVPLTTLEERWRPAGFVRVHRRHLVQLSHIDEVRLDSGRVTVCVGSTELAVSRRHTRQLRDLLVRNARWTGGSQ